MVKIGDVKILDNEFEVEVTNIFDDGGTIYAEVIPREFYSFPREVDISRLKDDYCN